MASKTPSLKGFEVPTVWKVDLTNKGLKLLSWIYFAKHLELRSTLPRLFREFVNAQTLSKIVDRQENMKAIDYENNLNEFLKNYNY